jgi:hypothetical protein
MNQRPWILVVSAGILMCIALAVPIQIMLLYGHGPSEPLEIFSKLTFLNCLIVVLGITTALLVLNGSPLIKVALPALVAVVAVNNIFVGLYATDFSMVTATLATVGFVLLNLPLLHPEIRRLFANPEQRWWRHARRKRLAAPVFLGGSFKGAVRSQTFDVSETGMFVPLSSVDTDLKVNETVSICLTTGVLSQVRVQGQIVRITEAKGGYPCGVGVKFLSVPKEQKRELRKFVERSPSL